MENVTLANTKRIGPDASVRVGSIWVPVATLPDSLARFTRLVFCLTGLDDHPYSLRGSATGLKFQGQHLPLLLSPSNRRLSTQQSGRPPDATNGRVIGIFWVLSFDAT
jgi:hypothetical protein